MNPRLLLCAALLVAFPGAGGAAPTASLRLRLEPRFLDQAIVVGSSTHRPDDGHELNVERLDVLLSGILLQQGNGSWVGPAESTAFYSASGGRLVADLGRVPKGPYRQLDFAVGLPPRLNHADPATFGPHHPLNPGVNGLHWSWQGGYVFLALEGGWRSSTNERSGYSFHLATDVMLRRVGLPIEVDLEADTEVTMVIDVGRLLSGPCPIRLSRDTASTHSRSGDPIATALGENLAGAFRIAKVQSVDPTPAVTALPVLVASDAHAQHIAYPSYFPQPSLPEDNPITSEGVALGRRLFQDPLLSVNNSQSCASCHRETAAFCDPGNRLSRGAEGRLGNRNAMSLFNLAWRHAFFWDGRAPSLRAQVLMPIENPVEMHENLTNVAHKLADAPGDYSGQFTAAFGVPDITPDRIARALEQFLLTNVAGRAKFDRVLRHEAEFTSEEQRGFELFHTEYDPRHGLYGADCFHCHGGPLFQSQAFADNGLDLVPQDPGRSAVTRRERDRGKFAVPSLRNVALTAPYMHDGRFATLAEVVDHYAGGVKHSPNLDPNLAKHPEGGVPLSPPDRRALVAFLETLTDTN